MPKQFLCITSIFLLSCGATQENYSFKDDNSTMTSVPVFDIAFSLPRDYKFEKIVEDKDFSIFYLENEKNINGPATLSSISFRNRNNIESYQETCNDPDQIYRCFKNATTFHFDAQRQALFSAKPEYDNEEGIMEYILINDIPFYRWNPPLIGDNSVTL